METEKQVFQRTNRVLITGAAGGLGKAFAVECASRGWDLFLTDTAEEGLEILAEGLRKSYRVKVVTHVCDLTNADAREGVFSRLSAEVLRISMLINVAGIDYEGPFFEQSVQQIQTIVRLNVESTLAMTHSALQYRDFLSPFRIINVASLAAFYPMPVKATYAASKRFLLDFSLALREELKGLGATVTVLCPAGMPTTRECIRAIDAQGWMGQITTVDTGRVAYQTIEAALANRAVVIPGQINRTLQMLGGLLPPHLVAALVGRRWKTVHHKRRMQVSSAAA